jgi:hypothetical protein
MPDNAPLQKPASPRTDMTDTPPPCSPRNARDAFAWLNAIAAAPEEADAHAAPTPAEYIRSHGRLRSNEQWAVIRSFLAPLVMQRVPAAEIARVFEVSVDTIGRWKKRLFDDMRREAVTMQPRDFIMDGMESLREARAEAWRGYYSAQTAKERRAFLQTVTQIEAQYGKLGAAIGLYGGRGDRPMSPATYNEVASSPMMEHAQRVLQMVNALLSTTNPAELHPDIPSGKEEREPESYEALLVDLRPPSTPAAPRARDDISVRVRRRPPSPQG